MQNLMQDILKKIIKAPAHNDKDVRIVEKYEENQVDETGPDGDQDDGVDVEDDPADRDDIRRPEILLKEEGGHVDNKVKGIEADHVVADCGTGITNWAGDAEHVDIRHVDRP